MKNANKACLIRLAWQAGQAACDTFFIIIAKPYCSIIKILSIMSRNRKKTKGKSIKISTLFNSLLNKKVVGILNILLIILNGTWAYINIQKEIRQKPLLENSIIQSKINVTKEYPYFEVNYFEIEHTAFQNLASGKAIPDSLSTNTLENYYVAKNDLLSLGEFEQNGTVVALAIRQIGGSLAKDVTIDFSRVCTLNGLDYFITTGDIIQEMDSDVLDVKGRKATSESYTIRYGDIPTGRGLIIPLFETNDLKSQDIELMDSNGNEVWSITGKTLLIPLTIHYRTIYDDSVKTHDIRKMNNSSITYSLFIEGRG